MSANKPRFGNANKPKASEQIADRKNGPKTTGGAQIQDDRIRQINDDVEEATAIMADNVQNMMNNLEKAEDIQEQTERLKENANQFQKNSKKLKKAMWWRNVKLWIIIIGIGVAILAVIALIIGLSVGLSGDKKKDENTDDTKKSVAALEHIVKYVAQSKLK